MADLITIGRLTALAFANSVNPCQIAMLVMVLMTILTGNTDNRKKVLYSGLAFTLAVFIGYLFYGVVLVYLFNSFANTLRESSTILRDVMSVFAMIVGALQIKDYFMYKPGGFITEMPLSFRPRVRILIKKITSPWGAFISGFLVTLFLAPCTMAPLLVATETLSQLGIVKALPWLMYFNLIVILPLLAITLIVYLGTKSVEDVSEWKERNIKRLHLIAGIILFVVGLALLLGWI